MRHLLLSCSNDKLNVSVPIPAVERYNGPAYKTLRLYFDDHPEARYEISTGIISARYGLIYPHTLIPRYDQPMTKERAQLFKKTIPGQLHEWIRGPHPETGLTSLPDMPTDYPLYELQVNGASDVALEGEAFADSLEEGMIEQVVHDIEVDENYVSPQVFCMLGKVYREIVTPESEWLPENVTIHYAQGSLVAQRTQLLAWLQGKPIPDSPKAGKPSRITLIEGREITPTRLKGDVVEYTPEQIEKVVEETLQDPVQQALSTRTKRWVAEVGEYRVSPKWLVSILVGKPTHTFDASEARRILTRLGINTVQYSHNPLR